MNNELEELRKITQELNHEYGTNFECVRANWLEKIAGRGRYKILMWKPPKTACDLEKWTVEFQNRISLEIDGYWSRDATITAQYKTPGTIAAAVIYVDTYKGTNGKRTGL